MCTRKPREWGQSQSYSLQKSAYKGQLTRDHNHLIWLLSGDCAPQPSISRTGLQLLHTLIIIPGVFCLEKRALHRGRWSCRLNVSKVTEYNEKVAVPGVSSVTIKKKRERESGDFSELCRSVGSGMHYIPQKHARGTFIYPHQTLFHKCLPFHPLYNCEELIVTHMPVFLCF